MPDWKCTLESRKEFGFIQALKRVDKLPSRIGIVVFGADCAFKKKIIDIIHHEVVGSAKPASKNRWDGGARNVGCSHIVYLNGNDSGKHECRHELVMRLRKDPWCEAVIGVYVKTEPLRPADDSEMTKRDKQFNRQTQRLIDAPPTPDGLDYLITVSEEEST